MTRTSIEWATDSWNPIAAYDRETGKRGWFCMKVSPGCTNCYAEVINRRLGNGHLYRGGNVDKVRFEIAPTLKDPLHWRQPRRVFVNSMTDLFLEQHTDEMIDEVFGVMGAVDERQPLSEFLILTKRAERQRDYMKSRAYTAWNSRRIDREAFPPRNVWLGVSVENQEEADRRIPLLLQTPATIRFLSCEPLLGPIDLRRVEAVRDSYRDGKLSRCGIRIDALTGTYVESRVAYPNDRIAWVIVGGESGSKAREFDFGWARDIVAQCHDAGVACFVKQMGSNPVDPWADTGALINDRAPAVPEFSDRKGGDMSEWPIELRVREFPKEAVCQPA